jgi:phytoene desaturase
MRVVVLGAGLGGLGVALRLQGAGHEVVVVEQRSRPGGRADRIRDGGYTWDTGPSIITMPWVLEETFAAGGLDLHREVTLRRLDPFFRIRWAGEERYFDFSGEASRMKDEIARFSERDAGRYDDFIAALRPIYERGILDAGRRPFASPLELAAFLPTMLRLRAALPLWRYVSGFFEHPRIREAFAFQSLFIGGDPFRVPAIYAALIYLQVQDGVWYSDGGVYSLVEAMARPLDVRCGRRVERIEHRGGAVTGVALESGERIAADAVVYNGDVLHAPALLGRRPPRRRLRPTMSAFVLYLGTDRRPPGLLHHTVLSGAGFRRNVKDLARNRMPTTWSSYIHAPARTEPAMAPAGGDSLAVLQPVPNLAANVDWGREADRVRDGLLEDLERTFGLAGLRDSIRVERRMTPEDFRDELGAFQGNAFATEPTLHQSAAFRTPNRDRRLAGMYYVGGGTHPGAGIPGVLLGAEITARLVTADSALAQTRRRNGERERAVASA